MKKYLAAALVWFIIAASFYASIWTNENNSLSDCFLLTGIVMIVQLMCTVVTFPLVAEIEKLL